MGGGTKNRFCIAGWHELTEDRHKVNFIAYDGVQPDNNDDGDD